MDPVALVPFAPPHYPTLMTWFGSEREIVQWGGPAVHYPLDPGQLDKMLSDAATPPTHLAWMALQAGVWVGHAQAISLDPSSGVARLGRIAIAPERRGQGLAVPMLRLVLAEAFAMPSIVRIDLGVYVWNVGAIKTYQRLGFQSGTVKRGASMNAAEAWDVLEMSLPRSTACPVGQVPMRKKCLAPLDP